ncbi:MAG: hypothetical protein LBM25_05260 [Bacteroidales bacterium]|jgi:hypothetical protein|nr:hypothetical protein [Bacteroidales bacterium]
MKPKENKKRIIISFAKLSQEQLVLFSQVYAEGYAAYLQKINKPSGEVIYVVPLETDDAIYMVKMDVKVDAKLTEEEFEKEIFKAPKDEEFEQEDSSSDEDEKEDKDKFTLVHGNYEDESLNIEDDSLDDNIQ